MVDNVIDLEAVRTLINTRTLTENEVRGSLHLLHYAIEFAAVTLVDWAMKNKKPGKMALEDLAFALHNAKSAVISLSEIDETDGHKFDGLAEHFMESTQKIKDSYEAGL
jgi:hypothetical protein